MTRDHLGKIAIKFRLGEVEDFDEFLVISIDASYNVLPLMHKDAIIPSTYHQYFKYLLQEGQGTLTVDSDPFSSMEAYHVESWFRK